MDVNSCGENAHGRMPKGAARFADMWLTNLAKAAGLDPARRDWMKGLYMRKKGPTCTFRTAVPRRQRLTQGFRIRPGSIQKTCLAILESRADSHPHERGETPHEIKSMAGRPRLK
jgi:hypothetical protein